MIQNLAGLPILKRVIPSIIKRLKISNIIFNYENLIFKLDADTGRIDKKFGNNGFVNLKISTKFSS